MGCPGPSSLRSELHYCLLMLSPSLDLLREVAEFGPIVRRAEAPPRDAVVTFLSAEADRVLRLGPSA
jgi:hypothetical protein